MMDWIDKGLIVWWIIRPECPRSRESGTTFSLHLIHPYTRCSRKWIPGIILDRLALYLWESESILLSMTLGLAFKAMMSYTTTYHRSSSKPSILIVPVMCYVLFIIPLNHNFIQVFLGKPNHSQGVVIKLSRTDSLALLTWNLTPPALILLAEFPGWVAK